MTAEIMDAICDAMAEGLAVFCLERLAEPK